jgi:hypothetical protein
MDAAEAGARDPLLLEVEGGWVVTVTTTDGVLRSWEVTEA